MQSLLILTIYIYDQLIVYIFSFHSNGKSAYNNKREWHSLVEKIKE